MDRRMTWLERYKANEDLIPEDEKNMNFWDEIDDMFDSLMGVHKPLEENTHPDEVHAQIAMWGPESVPVKKLKEISPESPIGKTVLKMILIKDPKRHNENSRGLRSMEETAVA